MNEKEIVLLFGLMLEADIFVDGFGITVEDVELYRKASLKIYGINDKTSAEEFKKFEEVQKEDVKALIESFRNKVKKLQD